MATHLDHLNHSAGNGGTRDPVIFHAVQSSERTSSYSPDHNEPIKFLGAGERASGH